MNGDQADALVLFGITGDLAKKKLIPALYELTAEGRLDMPASAPRAVSGPMSDSSITSVRSFKAETKRSSISSAPT